MELMDTDGIPSRLSRNMESEFDSGQFRSKLETVEKGLQVFSMYDSGEKVKTPNYLFREISTASKWA